MGRTRTVVEVISNSLIEDLKDFILDKEVENEILGMVFILDSMWSGTFWA